ncbi:WD40 repeat domain-containing protein [Stratiformator vulcanicus]|uniref:WD domain, G-beta repeat n=1 Tax=Stratiformator vulcanicus TaxID=2527980 RepID=A0A517R5G5_9PLAN|nr:cytochrome D1 domain-containing protein [Stratiformator vulcanicus]QDT39073.1 WD domain, G-beta repeat [Stratiformator vulcanicus]
MPSDQAIADQDAPAVQYADWAESKSSFLRLPEAVLAVVLAGIVTVFGVLALSDNEDSLAEDEFSQLANSASWRGLPIRDIACFGEKAEFAVCRSDDVVRIIDRNSAVSFVASLYSDGPELVSSNGSSDGAILAFGFADGTVKFLDQTSAVAVEWELHVGDAAVMDFAFDEHLHSAFAVTERGEFAVIDLEHRLVTELHQLAAGPVQAIRLSKSGSTIAFGFGNDIVSYSFDPVGGLKRSDAVDMGAFVTAAEISQDGRLALVSALDGKIRLVDLQAQAFEQLGRVSTAEGIRSLAFSPDGRYVAVGGLDGMVRIYDSSDVSTPISVFAGHRNLVCSVSFVDSNSLMSGSYDGEVLCWERESETITGRFQLR